MAKAKDEEIEKKSRNAIDCIEGVAGKAEHELRGHVPARGGMRSF